jgi:hypothetical protein
MSNGSVLYTNRVELLGDTNLLTDDSAIPKKYLNQRLSEYVTIQGLTFDSPTGAEINGKVTFTYNNPVSNVNLSLSSSVPNLYLYANETSQFLAITYTGISFLGQLDDLVRVQTTLIDPLNQSSPYFQFRIGTEFIQFKLASFPVFSALSYRVYGPAASTLGISTLKNYQFNQWYDTSLRIKLSTISLITFDDKINCHADMSFGDGKTFITDSFIQTENAHFNYLTVGRWRIKDNPISKRLEFEYLDSVSGQYILGIPYVREDDTTNFI